MKKYFSSRWAWLSKVVGVVAGVSALILTASASQAQVLVTGFYNQVGADFFYDFQVDNQSGLDVSIVELLYSVTPPAPVISGITQVPGFTFDVDSVTGSIVFAEDTLVFTAGSTVSGFRLTSDQFLNISPVVTGLNSDSTPFVGSFSAVAATVPEPGTLPLVALAGSALLGTIVARRRNVARL